jgi:AraC family transcriptional regulator
VFRAGVVPAELLIAGERPMKQELRLSATTPRRPLLEVLEASASKGEWTVPAVHDVSLALAVSDHSANWRDSRGRRRSEAISAGAVCICQFNQSRSIEMRNPAQYAIVLLRNEALEQVRHETRPNLGAVLQAHDIIQEPTLRGLIEVLLREKHDGFLSGSLFLDSIATGLASYLLRHYSDAFPVEPDFAGGIAPAALRRSIEYIEANLDRDLRLTELAREASLSMSHFVRSFRQSTGKTPHQFLLQQRVRRAQTLMRNSRTSLADVAVASGFADQHHLSRVFRRITGVTPTHFRCSL